MAKGEKSFKDRVMAFITQPAKAFDAEEKTDLSKAMVYGVFGLLIKSAIFAVLCTIVIGVFGIPLINMMLGTESLGLPIELSIGTLILLGVLMFAGVTIAWFVMLLIRSLWFHLWAYIFGARRGLKQTIKLVFFGNTPDYMLGWIPIVSVATDIWSLVLVGIGLTRLQKLSAGKAAAAVIIGEVIFRAIIVIVTASVTQLIGYSIMAA